MRKEEERFIFIYTFTPHLVRGIQRETNEMVTTRAPLPLLVLDLWSTSSSSSTWTCVRFILEEWNWLPPCCICKRLSYILLYCTGHVEDNWKKNDTLYYGTRQLNQLYILKQYMLYIFKIWWNKTLSCSGICADEIRDASDKRGEQKLYTLADI